MNQKKNQKKIRPAEKKGALMEISRFTLDLAKLVFAGIILGSIMDLEIGKEGLLIYGGIFVLLAIAGGAYAYYIAIKNY